MDVQQHSMVIQPANNGDVPQPSHGLAKLGAWPGQLGGPRTLWDGGKNTCGPGAFKCTLW